MQQRVFDPDPDLVGLVLLAGPIMEYAQPDSGSDSNPYRYLFEQKQAKLVFKNVISVLLILKNCVGP
jgi:hypothetical protein